MRLFSAIRQQSFIGLPTALPVRTFANRFDAQQRHFSPRTVPAQIQWILYGASNSNPNVAVAFNINDQGPQSKLDRVLGIRIDNLGVSVPIYVYFPDTGYTVVAPPNSVIWDKVQTSSFQALIIGEGFTDADPGLTMVYFNNFDTEPLASYEFEQVASLWKATANITRGGTIYNQNFGVPALGDQFSNAILPASLVGFQTLMGTPYSSGFLYVTNLKMRANGVTNGAGDYAAQLFFESTGTAGIFAQVNFELNAGNIRVDTAEIFDSGPVQWKLDATQLWRARVNILSGAASKGDYAVYLTFTQNPT